MVSSNESPDQEHPAMDTAQQLTQLEQQLEHFKRPADGPAIAAWLRTVAPERAAIGDLSDVLAWLESLGLVESSDDPDDNDYLWVGLRLVDIMRTRLDLSDERAVNYTVGAAVGTVTLLYLASIEDPDEEQLEARSRVGDYLDAHITAEKTRRLLATQQQRQRLVPPRGARARQSHRRRVAARRAAGIRSGTDPGDEGPSSSSPRLRLAPRPGVIYSFAVSRCSACGGLLLWQGGTLACANRSCPRWGQP
jgi:hypothetical protein